MDKQSRSYRARVRRRRQLLLAAGLPCAAALLLVLAATYRPAWYRPAGVDQARLHADKAALFELEDQISAALNAGREIRLQVSEDQINRWLAARAELWPEAGIDLGGLHDPVVSLSHGAICAAATASEGPLRGIIGVSCHIAVTDDEVAIHCDRVRLGAIPVPWRWISDALPRSALQDMEAITKGNRTITLFNDWLWPNGKRRCRLRELHVADGAVEVVIEPLSARRR